MLVWISSPVRSRKPVLMNTTRPGLADAFLRMTVVRRSSSMILIFSAFRPSPSRVLDPAKELTVAATSRGRLLG
jgi:hypothetical protein